MRIRITFSKAGVMQYVGHLDLHRSWERTFRRSGLPLAYSLGFHPQPRLNLACALPLGFTSQCEVLDAWLEEDRPLAEIQPALSAVLPPGLFIHAAEIIPLSAPSLQTQVASAVYKITFLDDIPDLNEHIQKVISADHIHRQRRGKMYDLRPLIEDIALDVPDEAGHPRLCLQLAAREAATGRPEELLSEMGICLESTQIHREKLIFL
jgi:radical SAM-linked protein